MELIDEEVVQQEAAPELPPAELPPVAKLPDRYSGKSLEDVVQMHQEAEKLIGRQAQEVGEVRKLADELLKQQLSKTAAPAQESELDFFEDPKKAVEQAVKNHPDVLAAKQATQQMQAMQTQARLTQKHPDFATVVGDGDFTSWIEASPVRKQLYAQANNYNFEAADELLSTYKQLRGTAAKADKEVGAAMRQNSLKAAAVDVSGSGESSKKVYRRADLIRLRMTDPNRYESLSDEIMQAYNDGRVK